MNGGPRTRKCLLLLNEECVTNQYHNLVPLRLTATVCLLLLLPGDVQANDVHELVGRGYELAYNLDHDEAVDTFEAAIVRFPDHPAPHRGLAAAAWMRLLFLRGTMTVDDYLGSVTPRQVEMPDPPRALADTFETHSERATELSEAMGDRDRDVADTHYELGASVALAASYLATIEGKSFASFRPAKRAYAAHERVLELDPSRKDANFIVGTYRYVASTLPLPVRLMARIAGFRGGPGNGFSINP